jgi:transposase
MDNCGITLSGGDTFAVAEALRGMRLTKAQIQQITQDLRSSPGGFGYAQAQWTGACLSKHLASRYHLVYGARQCRRLIHGLEKRAVAGSAVVQDAPAPVDTMEPRPWSGFSDTYRQEKTLQRLRQLSVSNLPLKGFAKSLFELMAPATNSGEAAQALFVGGSHAERAQGWILRDVETAEWTMAHPVEHERANSDDESISGMLVPAPQLSRVTEPLLAPGRFMSPRFHESPSYDEVWRHHNVYLGAIGVLRSGSGFAGLAPVSKSRREKPFTQSDLDFFQRAIPLITHGVLMGQAHLQNPERADETAPTNARIGIVTTDLRGRVVAIDQTARVLFFQPAIFDGKPLDAFSSSNLQAGLRYVSTIVRQTFQNSGNGSRDMLAVPAARVWWHGTGCVLLLRAVLSERLGRSPFVTILVEERETLIAKQKRLAIRYGMSPRESEILELAKAGTPRKEIASKLEISPNTVKTYLKQATSKMSEAGVL